MTNKQIMRYMSMKKKIISFAVCAVMILSQAFSASAAVSVTQKQVETVIRLLNIMNGDENKNLNLSAKVTRAEFAKIAVSASSFKDDVSSYSRVSPFADVSYSYWGASYIKTAADYGVISGYPDSTFRPENTVLLEEGVTVALKLLGYKDSDFTAVWPSGQINKAKDLKLLDNLNSPYQGAEMTRYDVMNLIYNTLTAKLKDGQASLIESVFGYSISGIGDIEQIEMDKGNIQGPFTINSVSVNTFKNYVSENAVYYRDDKSATADDITVNDIAYYSVELDKVWLYSDKVYGVYEKASPGKDSPVSVTVSGKEYKIESTAAAQKLANGGQFEYNQSVILLLGKDGEIADVMSPDSVSSTISGYITGAGRKTYQSSTGENYTSDYVTFTSADGKNYEYKTDKSYTDKLAKICIVKLDGDTASLTDTRQTKDLTGTFSAENMTLGAKKLSKNIKILDVLVTDSNYTPAAFAVDKGKIDKTYISSDDVLYYTIDENGEISEIYLNDFTNDGYEYGVVTDIKTTKNPSGSETVNTFVVNIKGSEMTLSGNYRTSISVGDGVKVYLNDGKIIRLYSLSEPKVSVKDIEYGKVYTEGKEYKVADDVVVYSRGGDIKERTYNVMKYSDLIGKSGNNFKIYTTSKPEEKIRIIVAE